MEYLSKVASNVKSQVSQALQKYAAVQAKAREDFQVSSFWVQIWPVPFNQRDIT